MKVMGIMMAGLLMAACGGDDDMPSTADRIVIVTPDASDPGPTPDAAPVACLAEETYGDAMFGDQQAFAQRMAASGAPDLIAGIGVLNMDQTPDIVQLELYKGFGPFAAGEIVPGTYQLTGAELQYSSCGVCVRVLTDLDTMGNASDSGYFATGGTVTITMAGDQMGGGTLEFTLSNITLEHVNINEQTFMSTPHPDMCESAVTSASFTAPIMLL